MLKSIAVRTQVFALRAEAFLLLLAMTALIVFLTGRLAHAETTRHTRTTTTTTVESDDEGDVVNPPANAAVPPPPPSVTTAPAYTESQMSQTFGSKATSGLAGCKTEINSKSLIKDLKRECAEWVKEQKKDLGKNYLGNTCEDACDQCEMSLVRCHVTGTVRYRKSADATVE